MQISLSGKYGFVRIVPTRCMPWACSHSTRFRETNQLSAETTLPTSMRPPSSSSFMVKYSPWRIPPLISLGCRLPFPRYGIPNIQYKNWTSQTIKIFNPYLFGLFGMYIWNLQCPLKGISCSSTVTTGPKTKHITIKIKYITIKTKYITIKTKYITIKTK